MYCGMADISKSSGHFAWIANLSCLTLSYPNSLHKLTEAKLFRDPKIINISQKTLYIDIAAGEM